VYGTISARFFSSYQQMNTTTNNVANAGSNVGNWFVFTGLSGPSVTLRGQRIDGTTRASIAGFQILPSAVAAPVPQPIVTALHGGTLTPGVRAVTVNSGGTIASITAAESTFAGGSLTGNGRAVEATVNHGSDTGHFTHVSYPSGTNADNFVYQATGLLSI